MPNSSTTYQATYLEPTVPGGFTGPLGKHRYTVAGALYVLQQKLREGMTPANAQAYLAAKPPDLVGPVRTAAGYLDNQAILTDFRAIDSL